MTEQINKNLIAPCGMNCGVCKGYLREKNKCSGCNSKNNNKPAYCLKCCIKLCQDRAGKYCFDCNKFPCTRLKQLDKRYRGKYGMSEIENLEFIRDRGIEEFLNNEHKKWQSEEGTFCVHDKKYYS